MEDFLIGSSPVYSLVSLLYVGYVFRQKGRPRTVPYELFPVILVCYGIANVVVKRLDQNRFEQYPYAFVGALLGLALSLIGRNVSVARTLFGFKENNALFFHLMAMGLYAAIFVLYVRWLNRTLYDQEQKIE